MKHLAAIVLALSSALAACSAPRAAAAPPPLELASSINPTCPRSGKPVAADSLTTYRGVVVGFCNTHCRDDFAAHVDERPRDRAHFDALVAER